MSNIVKFENANLPSTEVLAQALGNLVAGSYKNGLSIDYELFDSDLAEVKEQLPEEYLKIFGGAIEDFIESPSEL
jgi:hypothetical protein